MVSPLSLPLPFPVTEGTLLLRDGRALGYLIVGKPDGVPVVHCHGEPSSRLEVLLLGEPAMALGVRLIGFDRPGIGTSDPWPSMRLLDFPNDVAQAADQLGLGAFAISGFSGGGAFALACARKIPDRILACGAISAVPPGACIMQSGPLGLRLSYAVLEQLPAPLFRALVRRTMRLVAQSSEARTEQALLQHAARLGAGDRAVLALPEVRRLLAQSTAESYRQGVDANVRQALLLTRNWGFSVTDLRMAKIFLWHGVQDRIMPVASARLLAKALPHCRAAFYRDTGHLSTLITHASEILRDLAGL